jgi:hypothetical protein
MTTTTRYTIRDGRGIACETTDCEHAERLARAGLTVTAVTYNDD